jgi:hypothetical protein
MGLFSDVLMRQLGGREMRRGAETRDGKIFFRADKCRSLPLGDYWENKNISRKNVFDFAARGRIDFTISQALAATRA